MGLHGPLAPVLTRPPTSGETRLGLPCRLLQSDWRQGTELAPANSGVASAGRGLTYHSVLGFSWGQQRSDLSSVWPRNASLLLHVCMCVHLQAKTVTAFLEKTADKACWAFPTRWVLNRSVTVLSTEHWLRGVC